MSVPPPGASYPTCSDCQSAEVRPSRSTYPQDEEKLAAGAAGFWRCGNCGNRFAGPAVPPAPKEGMRRHHRKRTDALRATIDTQRDLKRWLFPLLVIVVTVIIVVLLLLQQNSQRMSLELEESSSAAPAWLNIGRRG